MASGCRIGKVRLKEGGAEVRVLSFDRTAEEQDLVDTVSAIIDDGDMKGWALVVWDERNDANGYFRSGGTMPGILIPDFAGTVLSHTMNNVQTLQLLGLAVEEE